MKDSKSNQKQNQEQNQEQNQKQNQKQNQEEVQKQNQEQKQKQNQEQKQKQPHTFMGWVEKIAAVLVLMMIWELAAMFIHQKILLVGPVTVFRRLLVIWQEEGFFQKLSFSLCRILGGFLLGMMLGVVLGIIGGKCRLFRVFLKPLITLIKAVPVASFVVICLIWMTGNGLTVFIAFLITMPIIYQNTQTGMLTLDQSLQDSADVLQIYGWNRIRYVEIPQVFSYMEAGINTAIGMAFKAGVAAEIIGTPNGSVGRELYLSRIYLDTESLFAWTVVIVVCSYLCERLVLMLLRAVKRFLIKI